MTRLLTILFSTFSLAHAARAIYTGFNYGAFWGKAANVKKAADFQAGFSLSQNLSTPIPFNSARLFTCKEQGTTDDPTGAFDAAVETNTTLLLGIWVTPAKKGDPLDDIIKTELSALGRGFEKHGQTLADLVIGLSVGSEDIYRLEGTTGSEVGVPANEIIAAIKTVKDSIASSTFAKYMQGKPIGHIDTAKYAVVDGADFYGITVYPYWNQDPVANARDRFSATLEDVKQRANNTPIWIAEMGWPFEGASQGKAEASAQNLQQFWTDVGCTIIGKYTAFWFDLIKDSEANQPDWGIIDPTTHQPRIDLSCYGISQPSVQPSAPGASASSSLSPPVASSVVASNSTTFLTLPSTSSPPASSSQSSQPILGTFVSASPPTASGQSTIHVTTTLTSTVLPPAASSAMTGDSSDTVTTTVTSTIMVKPSSSSKSTSFIPPANSSATPPPKISSALAAPSATILPSMIPWCITVADIAYNGQLLTVAGNPAGTDGKCGTPTIMTAAPSASVLEIDIPWCLTVADVAWNGQYVPVAGNPAGPDRKCSSAPTYNGLPYGTGQPSVPVPSSVVLNTTTPAAAILSSTQVIVSSVVPSPSSTLQTPAVPPASSSPLLAPPGIPAPSSTRASAPLSSTGIIASNSPAPSAPASSSTNRPPGMSSTLSSSAASVLIDEASSQHPYCKRKLGSLTIPAAPPASSAPVIASSVPSSSLATKASSMTLPDFTLVSGTPAAKRLVGAADGRERRWLGWW